jgi:hypothetical protein
MTTNTTGYTPVDDPRLLLLLVGLVIMLACLVSILYAMVRDRLVSEDTREAIRLSRATEYPLPDVEVRPLPYKVEPRAVEVPAHGTSLATILLARIDEETARNMVNDRRN